MIKSIVVTVVSALLVGVTLAEDKIETQECVEEYAKLLSEPVYGNGGEMPVEVSRKFYANFEDLLRAFGNWSNDYREAIRKADPEVFDHCVEILPRAVKTPESKCDLVELLERGSGDLMEIVNRKPETAEYFEAYYMCMVRQESEIKKCIEDSANFISNLTVPEDVEKLVEVSRQFYPNLEDLVEWFWKDPTSEFEEAMKNVTLEDLSYCDAVLENAEKLFEVCFANLFEDSKLDSQMIRIGPQTEKVFEAVPACAGARWPLEV